MKKSFVVLCLFLFSQLLFAANDIYSFHSTQQQNQFETLTTELRCLVCQNQNLAESNAPLASDLRQQIYQKILQGQSTQDIINYLVARYGDFILYQPPLRVTTFLLWFGPLLFIVIAIIILFRAIGSDRNIA